MRDIKGVESRYERSSDRAPSLVGVGGWLAVFQALSVFFALGYGAATFHALQSGGYGGALVYAAAAALNLHGVWLVAKRHPVAKPFWVAYLILGFCVGLLGRFDDLAALRFGMAHGMIGWMWLFYWRMSRRVKATFPMSFWEE